jgi:uncharacterized delta-60 repeat protein
MRRSLVTVLVLLATAAPAYARPGNLDRGFGNGGRVAYKVWGTGGSTTGLTLVGGVQPLLSVDAWGGRFQAPVWLRLNARGRLTQRVPIANPAGYASWLTGEYALTPLTRNDRPGIPAPDPLRYRFERIGAPSSIELTLPGADVLSATDYGVDAAGRITILGEAKSGAGFRDFLVRFLASGELDPSFGRVDLPHTASELIVKPDGRTYMVGFNRWLTALDPAGRPLPGFARGHVPRFTRKSIFVEHFIEGPAGTFLLAGDVGPDGWLARLRPDGRLDRRFGHRGYLTGLRRVTPGALARDARGRIVLGGTLLRPRGANPYQATVLRFGAHGRPDRTFATRGRKVFLLGRIPGTRISGSSIGAVAIDRRGRIVVAGEVFDEDFVDREDQGNPYPAVARLKG